MITAQVEGRWQKKLKDLTEEIKAFGATTCRIRPTTVLYELSQSRGTALLAMASRTMNARVKKEMAPKVKQAITGKKEGWQTRAAKVYRRWAYRFIEDLFVSVRDRKQWGRVDPETLKRKRKDAAKAEAEYQAELEARREARRAAAQKPRGPRGPNRGTSKPRKPRQPRQAIQANEAYGVRHLRPDWRQVQKGKAKAGKRRPSQQESGRDLIVVSINGRVIGRG